MKKTVFYSWQSDLPNATNRGYIQNALEKAVKAIANDESIEVEPVIDRDTEGVPGSPDISAVIFDKIKKADVFVADVSFINKGSKFRPTPNPNVLVELGFAYNALGNTKVILVMNTKFGSVEKLPFDLKMRKTVTYNSANDKAMEMPALASKIKAQLETIFLSDDPSADIEPTVIQSIKSQKPDRIVSIRSYMSNLSKDLDALYPGDGMMAEKTPDPEYDQKIIDALEKTGGIVASFRNLIDEIAIHDDLLALKTVFQGFKPIAQNFENKNPPSGGTSHKAKHDYYRFLGNEMFVIMASILLREQKWDLLKMLLSETFIIDNVDGYKTEDVDFKYFCPGTTCFALRKNRLTSNRADLRYDLLMERRKAETGLVTSAVEEYTSADLFLFLKGESEKINTKEVVWNWHPWSLLSFEMPHFILLAKSKVIAEGIAKALGVRYVQDFQILLTNKVPNIKQFYSGIPIIWRNPITDKSIQDIGSK